jgi:hypothetical protein
VTGKRNQAISNSRITGDGWQTMIRGEAVRVRFPTQNGKEKRHSRLAAFASHFAIFIKPARFILSPTGCR